MSNSFNNFGYPLPGNQLPYLYPHTPTPAPNPSMQSPLLGYTSIFQVIKTTTITTNIHPYTPPPPDANLPSLKELGEVSTHLSTSPLPNIQTLFGSNSSSPSHTPSPPVNPYSPQPKSVMLGDTVVWLQPQQPQYSYNNSPSPTISVSNIPVSLTPPKQPLLLELFKANPNQNVKGKISAHYSLLLKEYENGNEDKKIALIAKELLLLKEVLLSKQHGGLKSVIENMTDLYKTLDKENIAHCSFYFLILTSAPFIFFEKNKKITNKKKLLVELITNRLFKNNIATHIAPDLFEWFSFIERKYPRMNNYFFAITDLKPYVQDFMELFIHNQIKLPFSSVKSLQEFIISPVLQKKNQTKGQLVIDAFKANIENLYGSAEQITNSSYKTILPNETPILLYFKEVFPKTFDGNVNISINMLWQKILDNMSG